MPKKYNAQRLEILADHLEEQLANPKISDREIWHKLQISEATFYRSKPMANEIVNQRMQMRRMEVERTKVDAVIEAAREGVRTRTERVLLLQKHIEAMELELEANLKIDYVIVRTTTHELVPNSNPPVTKPVTVSKVQRVAKEMNALDRAAIRRTIKELQAEISKIEGDYAPLKLLDETPPTTRGVNLKNLPTEILDMLLDQDEQPEEPNE